MPPPVDNGAIAHPRRAPGRCVIQLAALGTFLAACGGPAPDETSIEMLLPDTIGDWTKQADPVTYDRETIFDYIDGAGEVYRSYAFRQVIVDRYESPGGLGVTVEVFDMGRAEDAFGVFSYAREQEEGGIGSGFERKGSVLCFWQDRFYTCVAAEQRTPEAGGVLEEVARGISERLPPAGGAPVLMTVLPAEDRIPFSDRFFHTHQSLNYQYYLARENILQLTPETDVALARYRPGSTYLLAIRYEHEEDASDAFSSFREWVAASSERGGAAGGEARTFIASACQGRFVVVVLDAESQPAADALATRTMDTMTRLLR